MKKVCSFTGHRPSSFDFGYDEDDARCIELKSKLFRAVSDACFEGYRVFYTGMAEGVDLWAAEVVLRVSAYFPDIELYAVMPYKGHRSSIRASFLPLYDKVLEFATDVITVSEKYTPTCFKARNYFLAEVCDRLIAVYDPTKTRSGTAQTVRKAETLSKEIVFIK